MNVTCLLSSLFYNHTCMSLPKSLLFSIDKTHLSLWDVVTTTTTTTTTKRIPSFCTFILSSSVSSSYPASTKYFINIKPYNMLICSPTWWSRAEPTKGPYSPFLSLGPVQGKHDSTNQFMLIPVTSSVSLRLANILVYSNIIRLCSPILSYTCNGTSSSDLIWWYGRRLW